MKLLIYSFIVFGAMLTSCVSSSSKYIADDVYMLKPNALPLGESSANEASYAAFKERKSTSNNSVVYSNQFYHRNDRRCLIQPMWFEGCGCSYSYWSMYSPYSLRSSNYMYSSAMGFGMYYMHPLDYGYMGYYPHYGYGNYGYYNPYSYGNPYNNYWGNYYGGNQMWYNNGNNSNYNGSYSTVNTTHRGPRGSISGYANPNGRQYSQTLKSSTGNTTNGKPGKTIATSNSPVRKSISNNNSYAVKSRPTKEGSNQTISSRPTRSDYVVTNNRPSTNASRTNTSGSNSSGSSRTYNSGSSNSGTSRTIGSGSSSSGNSGSSGRSSAGSNSGGSRSSGSSSSGSSSSGRSGGRR